MNIKTMYRRFTRRFEDMDDYERMRVYTITGICAFTFIVIVGLTALFYLRYLDVVISVDTAGLLGKSAVFVDNTSSSSLRHVYVSMDGTYTTEVNEIKPKQSIVVYFTSFKPQPQQNYMPKKVTVRSGFAVKTKSISASTQ